MMPSIRQIEADDCAKLTRRLTGREIGLLRWLVVRCGLGGVVSLRRWQRAIAVYLWRRELVQVWYRQSPDGELQGPFFGLSVAGRNLALLFTAPRAQRAASAGGAL